MYNKVAIISILLCINVVTCLYDSSKVVVLNSKNFKERVINSNELWMIEFFAPWCGHCKSLAPEYAKLAKGFDGIVNIGAVDMDATPVIILIFKIHFFKKDVGSPYGIKGFPTLKFFGDNKNSPIDYNGERNFAAMQDFIFDQTKKAVQQRSSGKSSSSSSRESRHSKSGGSGSGSNSGASDKDVVVLEDDTFDELVFKSKDSWLVEFYAPWCGHCKKLEPEWNKLASDLKGEVKVAKIDATVQTKLAQRFGVSGYPTIKFFPAGSQSDGDVQDYGGARDASSLASFAREQFQKFKPLDIQQLTSQANYDEYCVNFNGINNVFKIILKGICVIVFLPHIYDSSKNERNDYLKILEDGATTQKGKPIAYLWSQGGDNYEFEEAFQSGSAQLQSSNSKYLISYPSVLALSSKKSVYAKLRGVFNAQSFEGFLKNVLSGRESFLPFTTVPKLQKTSPWDGQDHKLEQPLEDI